MQLLNTLLTTPDGWIALGTTLVALLLALGFRLFFRRVLAQSEAEQQRRQDGSSTPESPC